MHIRINIALMLMICGLACALPPCCAQDVPSSDPLAVLQKEKQVLLERLRAAQMQEQMIAYQRKQLDIEQAEILKQQKIIADKERRLRTRPGRDVLKQRLEAQSGMLAEARRQIDEAQRNVVSQIETLKLEIARQELERRSFAEKAKAQDMKQRQDAIQRRAESKKSAQEKRRAGIKDREAKRQARAEKERSKKEGSLKRRQESRAAVVRRREERKQQRQDAIQRRAESKKSAQEKRRAGIKDREAKRQARAEKERSKKEGYLKRRQESRAAVVRRREERKQQRQDAIQRRAESKKSAREKRIAGTRDRKAKRRDYAEQRAFEKAAAKQAALLKEGRHKRIDRREETRRARLAQEQALQNELDACRQSLSLMEREIDSPQRQTLQERIDKLLERQRALLDNSRQVEQDLLEQKKSVEILLEQAGATSMNKAVE
ncbi:MAG: hypothetical protein KBC23_06820 [Candidatus Omnitrophica bacterium]|nr:hypothetical protein [Candidatus Omnitrophota bacterium]